jgi:hypothetical protein
MGLLAVFAPSLLSNLATGTPGFHAKKFILLKQVTHELLQVTVLLLECQQLVNQISGIDRAWLDLSGNS